MKKQNKFDFTKCSCDFSLILLIFLFVSYPKFMKKFSHTFLGRLLAIFIIIFYSIIDIFYGFFFCIVVIYYYQLDYNENSLNIHEGFFWDLTEKSGKTPYFEKDILNTTEYSNYKPENIYQAEGSNFDLKSISNTLPIESILPEDNEEQKKFKNENCVNGILKKGDLEINPEMAEHIFNDLKFDGSPCDPCNRQCKFSIINKKISTEEELIKPKNSNDWVVIVRNNLKI